jgi:hypothetical protein
MRLVLTKDQKRVRFGIDWDWYFEYSKAITIYFAFWSITLIYSREGEKDGTRIS